jgi:hypothetical protein
VHTGLIVSGVALLAVCILLQADNYANGREELQTVIE